MVETIGLAVISAGLKKISKECHELADKMRSLDIQIKNDCERFSIARDT